VNWTLVGFFPWTRTTLTSPPFPEVIDDIAPRRWKFLSRRHKVRFFVPVLICDRHFGVNVSSPRAYSWFMSLFLAQMLHVCLMTFFFC